MLGEEKNLKDSESNQGVSIKDTYITISYRKTDKLVTALYMVTDIIDKEEPLRNKLRTLGVGIISDMHSAPQNILRKISEISSFLGVASDLNIISEMNCSILRKEFSELSQAIKESYNQTEVMNKQINLADFFRQELPTSNQAPNDHVQYKSIGHHPTRIGVQKGSTLMKALSDRNLNKVGKENFDLLKKERRYDISNFIIKNGGSATITDIRNGAQGSIVSCSEKTLQRELVSMAQDGVLKKAGEKRWSRYFLIK